MQVFLFIKDNSHPLLSKYLEPYDHSSNLMTTETIENPLDKLPEILKKNLDRNLCVCNEVLKRDIISAIAKGVTMVEEIKKQTYATEGNGCCTQQVERLIEYLTDKKMDDTT